MAGLLKEIFKENFRDLVVLGSVLFIAILRQIFLINTVETWFSSSTEILFRHAVISFGNSFRLDLSILIS